MNERGGIKSPGKERKEEKKEEICKFFKFGGKWLHGMNGLKKHKQWDKCKKAHPKVCNKLLTNGVKGCDGKECEKFHPKMCYSSMNTRRCTKEKCTFWHCKGTSFTKEVINQFQAPSPASLGHYPAQPGRHNAPQ